MGWIINIMGFVVPTWDIFRPKYSQRFRKQVNKAVKYDAELSAAVSRSVTGRERETRASGDVTCVAVGVASHSGLPCLWEGGHARVREHTYNGTIFNVSACNKCIVNKWLSKNTFGRSKITWLMYTFFIRKYINYYFGLFFFYSHVFVKTILL